MRTLILIISVAGAYALLRGWQGAPGMLLRSCLAVATLVAGLAFWSTGKRSPLPRMFCLRRVTWLDYLSLGAAIVFTEACFVVITSTLAAPAQNITDAFHGTLTSGPPAEEKKDSGPQFDGHTSGNWLFNNSLERNLPPNSNHKPSNKPEVFVELDNKADATRLLNSRIHLRAFAMSKFNGISWSAARENITLLQAPITFPRDNHQRISSEAIKHTVYHAVNPTGQNVFTALQGVISSDVPSLSQLSNAIYLLPPADDPTSGYTYSATSRPVNFTDLIGENPTTAEADPRYLALPDNLSAQIRKTAELFQHEPDLTNQLISLRVYLQDNYTYSLETTNASGANPVENFLYREKRGYCEHFATATALLCRALGVPSRIAYGWSGGKLYPAQNMFVFRSKDAHAWTEIKLDGYGWIAFDTTPPDDAVPEAQKAPEGEEAPDPLEAISTDTGVDETENELLAPTLDPGFHPARLTGALIVLGICCAAFLFVRHIKRPITDNQGKPLPTPPPGYLLSFKQACASLGKPMPTGCTLRQHIRTLRSTDFPPEFASDLLDYHYGVLYGDLSHDAAHEKSLIKSISKWIQKAKQG